MTQAIAKRCALCLNEAELRLSHIIPEFAYKPMYDEKHRMHAVPGHAPETNFYLQQGLRYPLLCGACETLLNTNYEDPFKQFWVDGQQLALLRASSQNVIRNIDYAKFKLFHLSVLWRASVCQNPAFHRVSLGPHEEPIRKMLVSQQAGPASLYPIVCGMIIDDDEGFICDALVVTPLSLTLSGHRGFMLAFCGCQWFYFVSSHAMPEVERIRLNERGTMTVDIASRKRLFQDFYRESRKAGRRYGSVDARRLLSASSGASGERNRKEDAIQLNRKEDCAK